MDPGIKHRPHRLEESKETWQLRRNTPGSLPMGSNQSGPINAPVFSCSGLGSFIRVNESDVIDHQRVV